MTNKIDIYSKYNETIETIRLEVDAILKQQEENWISGLPKNVRAQIEQDVRGHYKRDLNVLLALITPELYASCIEAYEPKRMAIPFHKFLLREASEQIPALLCNTLPAILGEDEVKSMIRFFVGNRFPDLNLERTEDQDEDDSWNDEYILFFKTEIGEIGTRKLQKLEINPRLAAEALKCITDDYVCGATTSDIIAAVDHYKMTGEFPDIDWLQQRS